MQPPPMEAKITVVVRKCELSFISLRMENIWRYVSGVSRDREFSGEMEVEGGMATYVLVACICENDDRKGGERRDEACGLEHTDGASLGDGVAFDEVCYD